MLTINELDVLVFKSSHVSFPPPRPTSPKFSAAVFLSDSDSHNSFEWLSNFVNDSLVSGDLNQAILRFDKVDIEKFIHHHSKGKVIRSKAIAFKLAQLRWEFEKELITLIESRRSDRAELLLDREKDCRYLLRLTTQAI